MFINFIIVTIFLLLVLICVLPLEVIVISIKLLFLNMQIFASWFYYFFSQNNKIIVSVLKYFGIKKSIDVNIPLTSINLNDDEINLNFINDDINNTDVIDQVDFNYFFDNCADLIFSYNYWFFLPMVFYCFIIYFLHAFFGIYSAYVDYFQKNPDHLNSMRGFLPAVFIFYFVLFILIVIFLFLFSVPLFYIVWFLFI